MTQAISAPVLTQEEVLTALITLGEDPTASRVAALHHRIGATSLPAGVRADAVLQAVAGARSDLIGRDAPALYRKDGETFELKGETIHGLPAVNADAERGHSGLPAFASSEEMAMPMSVSPMSRYGASIEVESAATLSSPGEAVSEEEVLSALESMGEQPTALRVELLRELVDEKWWPTAGRELAVREAVDAARKHLDEIPGGKDGLLTARAIRETYPSRNLPSSVVNVLYAVRRVQVNKLERRPEIGVDELAELDRLGRFRVADELFGKCNLQARHALLNDAHPHVQSAARLSMDRLAAKGETMRRAADEVPSPEF